MSKGDPEVIRLGLIGDNIAKSRAPDLHCSAGQLAGLNVTYDRLVPKELGLDFDGVFEMARKDGFRGINVTYPYKETVTAKVTVDDPLVRAIGAVNTVVFEADGSKGFNTDYSGFIRAWRGIQEDAKPGTVCLIGSGGVGKAVAFALVALGAEEIRCVDLEPDRAKELADSLTPVAGETRIVTARDAESAAVHANGIVNCTPLGMTGIGGTPVKKEALANSHWAFDAVYTPVETEFLRNARDFGLIVITGYELFFGQGVDAWDIFTGAGVDQVELRAAIRSTG
ncbi:shikimate dehydrogenase family protein [Amaricoccus tamworthensis]|uniref:shikimate dehydrogenase family protein n=1 Tax=Amaricoccus tamworthensis TaxID=57002 RepID=UPI003C7E8564